MSIMPDMVRLAFECQEGADQEQDRIKPGRNEKREGKHHDASFREQKDVTEDQAAYSS